MTDYGPPTEGVTTPPTVSLSDELAVLPAEEQEALDALLVALWQCRTERSFGHMRAKVEAAVAQIAVTRERRAAYFAMWQFFLRLPSPTPMSDTVQREAMRLRDLIEET